MATGAAIAGGMVASSLIGGMLSSQGVSQQNSANAAQQMQAEQYQTNMSNTSYQRGVKDMEAAGLNPMLAYSQGGASTPSIAPVQMQNTMAPLGDAIAKAGQVGLTNASAYESMEQTKAQTATTQSQAVLNSAAASKAVQDAQTSASQQKLNDALAAKAKVDATSAAASARLTTQNANKLEATPWLSDIVGTDRAQGASNWLNSATDYVSSKIHSVLSGLTTNSAASARRVSAPPPKIIEVPQGTF